MTSYTRAVTPADTADIGADAQSTTGHLEVHSCPRALTRHVEWALARESGHAVSFDWQPQPLIHGAVRGQMAWSGPAGMAPRLASALHGWKHLRYEVTVAPSHGVDGGRWMHTPSLGIAHLATDSGGSAILTEHRIEAALADAEGDPARFMAAMRVALASAWDEELELFRAVRFGGTPGEHGGTVHWLHRAG